jgi:hypothetical protein
MGGGWPRVFDFNWEGAMKRMGATAVLLILGVGMVMGQVAIEEKVEPASEQDAWEMLFLIFRWERPSKDEGWDLDMLTAWLKETGLTRLEVQEVDSRVNDYFREIAPLEEEIKKLVATLPLGDELERRVNEIMALKRAKLEGQVAAIDLAPERAELLRAFVRDEVKPNTRVSTYAQGAQAMGGRLTGYTAATTHLTKTLFTAKGVMSTGGSFGHTAKLTTTACSPAGRSASATSGIGYAVTATAWLDLCSFDDDIGCEDGNFRGLTTGQMFCPYGSQFPSYQPLGCTQDQTKK